MRVWYIPNQSSVNILVERFHPVIVEAPRNWEEIPSCVHVVPIK